MKECLKEEINERMRLVVNDCRTFVRVRRELSDWYRETGVGGGNFMMAQSLFAALNFLAKVYARLRHRDKYFYSPEDKDGVKTAVRELKAKDKQAQLKEIFPGLDFKALLGDALTQWKSPRPGDCANETRVFKLLVEAMGRAVDLGFQAADAEIVWQQFRNKLAHMAAPGSMVESGGAADELRSFGKSDGGDWICNVDRLTEDIQAIAAWVCQAIDHETDEGRIRDTLDWIRDVPGHGESNKSVMTTTTIVTTQSSLYGFTGPYSVTHPPPLSDHGRTRSEAPHEQEGEKG